MEYAIIVFFLLHLLDVITTSRGLRLGATEKNPLARAILERLGVLGLYSLKMIIGGILLLVAWFYHSETLIWGWNIIMALVVTWNSYVNMRLARHGETQA